MPPSPNPCGPQRQRSSASEFGGKSKIEFLSLVGGAALVRLISSALIRVVGVTFVCVVRCRESQTCGRSEQHHASQAQHIGACEQSKGEAKKLYLDPPCGNGLLVSSIAVLPRADLTWRVHQR